MKPSSSPEEARPDKPKLVEGGKVAVSAGPEPHKSKSEELSDEELERRRNALLQQLHEEAD
ncbi:hypothetical protein J6590_105404 [Homalodisca vitripennis]|nr:hypothetical protein J6590_025896 [Homalodisca vitripennis]KAG8303967.1 hypothetical protein J6590_105404 [Homalodisca vitripennis]